MKYFNLISLFIALTVLVSCSTKKEETETAELTKDSDFQIASEETDTSVSIVAEEVAPVDVAETNVAVEEVAPTDTPAVSEAVTQYPVEKESEVEVVDVKTTEEVLEYSSVEGDTLMFIAFKIYGDYAKWKDIHSLNPKIKGKIKEGTVVRYRAPLEKFIWEPKGLPHVIRSKDTLGLISKDKYGTEKRWKDIFDNNRPMIKNPNLIFAGFTLYYIPSERDLASGKGSEKI